MVNDYSRLKAGLGPRFEFTELNVGLIYNCRPDNKMRYNLMGFYIVFIYEGHTQCGSIKYTTQYDYRVEPSSLHHSAHCSHPVRLFVQILHKKVIS